MKGVKKVKEDDLREANKLLARENEESWGKIKNVKITIAGLKHAGKKSILISDLEEII